MKTWIVVQSLPSLTFSPEEVDVPPTETFEEYCTKRRAWGWMLRAVDGFFDSMGEALLACRALEEEREEGRLG